MFDERLFFFVSLKIGIFYKAKKSPPQRRENDLNRGAGWFLRHPV